MHKLTLLVLLAGETCMGVQSALENRGLHSTAFFTTCQFATTGRNRIHPESLCLEGAKPTPQGLALRMSRKDPNDSGGGISPFGGFFLGGLFKPKKPKTEIDTAIDRMLQDAPLPIKLMGGLFKGIANIAGEAMSEAADDIERVRDATLRALKLDSGVTGALGKDVTLGPPFSQAMSSSSINGVPTKRASLEMPISGSSGSGLVSVDASIDAASKVVLNRCSLNVNGKVTNVSLLNGGGWGGGGDGGSRSGGANQGGRRVHDDDGVIDVEAR